MNISNRLQVKYGLNHAPSDIEINSWNVRYLLHKLKGADSESAGHQAARDTFADYGTIKYASAADTIEALLAEIEEKEKGKR